jgi:hypothetical protein
LERLTGQLNSVYSQLHGKSDELLLQNQEREKERKRLIEIENRNKKLKNKNLKLKLLISQNNEIIEKIITQNPNIDLSTITGSSTPESVEEGEDTN